jgi:SAM-dependent methyltransferase
LQLAAVQRVEDIGKEQNLSNEVWREFWSVGESAEHAIGGAHRDRLTACWRAFFRENLALTCEGALIADIASGAGAALAVAGDVAAELSPRRFLLAAFDISSDAVRSSMRRATGAVGAVSDAARLPLAKLSVDVAVSQYGAEYAGAGAFAEIARCLAPGGVFMSLSHYSGGAIDAECAANMALVDLVGATNLGDAAEKALKESFARRRLGTTPAADSRAEKKLRAAYEAAAACVAKAPRSAARDMFERYLRDLGALLLRRLAYDEGEALGWIDGMRASLLAYRGRMASMQKAALDAAAVAEIGQQFARAGVERFEAQPFVLVEGAPPAAWRIMARRRMKRAQNETHRRSRGGSLES